MFSGCALMVWEKKAYARPGRRLAAGTCFTPRIAAASPRSSTSRAPASSYSAFENTRLSQGCTRTRMPSCARPRTISLRTPPRTRAHGNGTFASFATWVGVSGALRSQML